MRPVARGLVLLAVVLGPAGCARENEPPPSVILVSLDTLRADHVGFYGHHRATTPYLDRLARESIVFEHAYAPAAWTLVSHMTMLTGLYPRQHGVIREDLAVSEEIPLLAEILEQHGYQTAGLYFRGWIDARHGFARGFDVFLAHDDMEEAELHMQDVLSSLIPERPFFLFIHLFDIHSGHLGRGERPLYEPPDPFDRIFDREAREKLAGIDCEDCWEGRVRLSDDQLEALRTLYDGSIRYVDGKLADWVEDWRERGLLDRALLIVTSDHGEALGQRGGKIKGHGGLFQEGLRVPLLVRFPDGRHAGRRFPSPVSLVDVVPTILREAGLAPGPGLPGVPLPDGRPAGAVLAGIPPRDIAIDWPWKVAWHEGTVGLAFHLERDPLELRALVVGDALAEPLWRSIQELCDYPAAIPIGALEAKDAEALRALGYGGE